MDEPTASLDLGNALLVLERVRALREQGYGIVFSTHDPDQAHELATRVAVIADGRLAAYGSPEETLTGEMLSAVYGVAVMVERTSSGRAVASVHRDTERHVGLGIDQRQREVADVGRLQRESHLETIGGRQVRILCRCRRRSRATSQPSGRRASASRRHIASSRRARSCPARSSAASVRSRAAVPATPPCRPPAWKFEAEWTRPPESTWQVVKLLPTMSMPCSQFRTL